MKPVMHSGGSEVGSMAIQFALAPLHGSLAAYGAWYWAADLGHATKYQKLLNLLDGMARRFASVENARAWSEGCSRSATIVARIATKPI